MKTQSDRGPLPDNMRDLIQRVHELMAERHLTGRQLALRMGYSTAYISRLLKGDFHGVRSDTIVALARVLGVPTLDLWENQIECSPAIQEPLDLRTRDALTMLYRIEHGMNTLVARYTEKVVHVPELGEAPFKKPLRSRNDPLNDYYPARPRVIAKAPHAFYITIRDQSLEPEHQRGDLALVDPGRSPCDQDIVLFYYQSELLLRHYYQQEHNRIALLGNGATAPIVVYRHEIALVGVMIHRLSDRAVVPGEEEEESASCECAPDTVAIQPADTTPAA